MRKTLTLAFALAALAGITAGPASAQTTTCPPGVTDTTYCQVAEVPPLGLSPVAGQKLLNALKSGLKVSVSCPSDCTLTVNVTIPGSQGKKLKIAAAKPVVVAKGKTTFAQAGKKTITVKFTKKAKKALKKLKKLKLGLVMNAANKAGVKSTRNASVTLKK